MKLKNLNHRTAALILAFIILIASIPAFASGSGNGAETPDVQESDVPFSFTLEEGDLPFSELADAVLDPCDLPDVIGADLAAERGHVNRLYAQEPDDYTVMFQNRNGSKTIYYFSKPVKQNGRDLNKSTLEERIINTDSAISLSGNRISFPSNSIIPVRLTVDSSAKLNFYNIGYAGIAEWNADLRNVSFVDITKSVRDWSTDNNRETSFEMISKEGAPVILSGGGMLMLSINYSDIPGDWAIKTVPESVSVTAKYLMNSYPIGSNSAVLSGSQSNPRTRWLISYDYDYYILRSQSNQLKYLAGDDVSGNACLWDYDEDQTEAWEMECWIISIISNNDGTITLKNLYNTDSYLCHFGTAVCTEEGSYIENDENVWKLVNKNSNFAELLYFEVDDENAIIKTGDLYSVQYSSYPSNASYQAYEMILPYPAVENEELEFYSDSPVSGTVTVKYTYCPTKTSTFHIDVIDYPNSEASFIQSGGKYEIFAVDDSAHKSLHYASGGLTYTAYPQNSNANSFIFTYVSNGRYRISPESDSLKCLTYSSGALSVSNYNSLLTQTWYPILFNNRLYLANGSAHSKVISYSIGESSVTPCISSINDCNNIALPLAVPLYMQGTYNTCGPCNMSMIMNYLGHSYTESFIKNEIVDTLYDPNNQNNLTEFDFYSAVWCLTWFANTYSQSAHNYYNVSSLSISDLQDLLWANYSLARPCINHVKTDNNGLNTYSLLGYPTKGHYLCVKGLFHSDNITYVIINDCHYNYCGEKSIPISDFHHLIMNGHNYYIGATVPSE